MHVHFKFMLLLHAAALQKQERNIQKHKFMLVLYQEGEQEHLLMMSLLAFQKCTLPWNHWATEGSWAKAS